MDEGQKQWAGHTGKKRQRRQFHTVTFAFADAQCELHHALENPTENNVYFAKVLVYSHSTRATFMMNTVHSKILTKHLTQRSTKHKRNYSLSRSLSFSVNVPLVGNLP